MIRFASLLLAGAFALLQTGCARAEEQSSSAPQTYLGAITRGSRDLPRIALCFTAHSYAEGADVILDTLKENGGKASFFLTGDFLANTNFMSLVQRMLVEGHYVGPHSDKHLLYCAWEPSRKTLVTRPEFLQDLKANVAKIERHRLAIDGSKKEGQAPIRYFLPPYEHYNEEIARWTRGAGLILVNFTPGTRSNADYTGEADKNFVPSDVIYRSIMDREKTDPDGLNGFLLLLHLGAGPGRTDKFHHRFGELYNTLGKKGYKFVRIDELLER